MARPEAELLRIADMAALEQVVKGCTACRLRAGCRGVVFGDGNPAARLMLIGEGPGADEDRLGRPFVGRAGQLLDRILAACGFDRQRHVYIANVVKCRPPGNRTPTPDERAACLPNLRAQMRLVNPVIVVLLGSTALQALIDPAARITRWRGQWIHRDGVWYMPTYHPAALLRNPSLKRDCWHDFKKVIDKYRELVDPYHVAPHHPPEAAEEPAGGGAPAAAPGGRAVAGEPAAGAGGRGPGAGAAVEARAEAAAAAEPAGVEPAPATPAPVERAAPGAGGPGGTGPGEANAAPPGVQLTLFDFDPDGGPVGRRGRHRGRRHAGDLQPWEGGAW
ncbi:phage SPO1 DNA polymerase-related protein [Thermaerobacter marianensis DSM 12885]|uniref:Type-4 uracil-DNA glycosylase n=1 Tax=Thermaerobacter marianensis (strain ATCC 700841 / DSM 12885 / JCM 10246 / 7p75a) TaxID=644966 RepID=E6SM60_THEM7|nr:uracil-DNA glycosylase [Thermaerobacter marianensis]ADU50390.1 phage SPO1 DNA polymerase-related protein [Thermaerobacter marianensis DSM 12885]